VEARRRAPRQAPLDWARDWEAQRDADSVAADSDGEPRRIARGKEVGEAGDVKEAKEAKELEEVAARSPDSAAVCKLATPRGEGFLLRLESTTVVCFVGVTAIPVSEVLRLELDWPGASVA
jgi:hypothetical protein